MAELVDAPDSNSV